MDMPDLVMRKIMENVDFITILKLRKVCHAFRNFIDDTTQDYRLTHIQFSVYPSMISVEMRASWGLIGLHYVRYKGGNCLRHVTTDCTNKTNLMKGEDFVEAVFDEIGVILKIHKAPLEDLSIHACNSNDFRKISFDKNIMKKWLNTNWIFGWCSRQRDYNIEKHLSKMNKDFLLKPTADKFYDGLEKILRSRDSLMRLKCMAAQVIIPQYFLKIAPFIDLKTIKYLELMKESDVANKELKFDKIVELDNWECIQDLRIKGFGITVPVEKFLHKSSLKISISTISMEDVLLIQTNFLNSPSFFEEYTIHYEHLTTDVDELDSILGYFTDAYEEKCWGYAIPETDKTLEIRHSSSHRYFTFTWDEEEPFSRSEDIDF
ncbi:hypothetical protein CRE_14945 [Caenorhabditis remanei]|uniref:F-box domain-containing protein n=1 Tax=Caenorhabditis remanei TaxID=31234 RepID=E3NBV7_CAERE|nr:hypothetical protein CRE_14945 [Caenorhabditis remanei]